MTPEVVAVTATVFGVPAVWMYQDKVQALFARVFPPRKSEAREIIRQLGREREQLAEMEIANPFDWDRDFSEPEVLAPTHPAHRPKLTLVRGIDRGLV